MQQQFSDPLLAWFDQHGRKDLPWQQNVTPYRVWLSEIMLQQTQVNTVIPYFIKFTEQFADVTALANANIDQVLALWSGLGYYARARNLHKAANMMVEQHQGELPNDFDALIALPGIGRSTAGAIMALAYHQRYPILDGNVKRVLTRFKAVEGWPGHKAIETKLWGYAEQLLPEKRFANFIQAQMDLGATLCTRSKPKCECCPLSDDCQAFNSHCQTDYPTSKPKKTIPQRDTHWIILLSQQGELLLEQREAKGIWGNLWSFPEVPQAQDIANFYQKTLPFTVQSTLILPVIKHVFTHFKLDIYPHLIQGEKQQKQSTGNEKYQWYTIAEALQLGVPAPVKQQLINIRDFYGS